MKVCTHASLSLVKLRSDWVSDKMLTSFSETYWSILTKNEDLMRTPAEERAERLQGKEEREVKPPFTSHLNGNDERGESENEGESEE